jgi:hypothetical protein
MLKWRLMLTTLPFVLAAAAIKYLLRFTFDFDGLVEFSDVGVVLTGAVFLIGFMLAGTMADYKESEKLPGELACSLEALEENLLHAAAAKPAALDAAAFQARVHTLAATLRAWLVHEKPQADVFAALTQTRDLALDAERAGASSHAGRALAELQNIRKGVTRVGVISRTGFLASGYALLDTLVVLSIAVLFVAKFKSTVGEVILVPFVTLIFVYMVKLIRDVDDPFSYGPGGARGAAEVELTPLDDYIARLRGRAVEVRP